MTKDLLPTNPAIRSPLRDLDWEDDDYTMEIVSSRLYDRDIHDIYANNALLNDRGGEITFFPSMAEHGDHSIKMAIPPKILLLLEQIAFKFHDMDLSDAIRIAAVHGLAIYDHEIGCEIERIYYDNTDAQIDGNEESVMRHLLSANVDYKHVKYSCWIEARLFQILSKYSAHAGCGKQYMAGIWVLYSIRTHPRMKKWLPLINDTIKEFESTMKLRLKILQ